MKRDPYEVANDANQAWLTASERWVEGGHQETDHETMEAAHDAWLRASARLAWE